MTGQLAVAVVGAGKWGQNLIKNFHQLNVLAAIVEPDYIKGQALASAYNVPHYTHLESVLMDHIDAIAIATPVFTHYQLAKQALLAKKDVFVEKPMTRTTEEADDLIHIAAKNECILMVGHLLLYQPAIQFIRNFLEENKLGDVFSFRQIRRSLGTIRQEENVLYSLGVHDLAVLHFLNSEKITRIMATAHKVISHQIADEMNIHLHYHSGRQAHLHLNWLWPIKDRQLMILGEKGALHFDEQRQEVTFHQNYGTKEASLVQGGSNLIFSDQTPPLSLELQHFIDCVIHRKIPNSCGRQGRDVVHLMAKIMEVESIHHEQELLST